MIFLPTFLLLNLPALLDKYIYIYYLLICRIWLCQKPIPMRMISVALKKYFSSHKRWFKKKKFYVSINSEININIHLSVFWNPELFGLGIAQGCCFTTCLWEHNGKEIIHLIWGGRAATFWCGMWPFYTQWCPAMYQLFSTGMSPGLWHHILVFSHLCYGPSNLFKPKPKSRWGTCLDTETEWQATRLSKCSKHQCLFLEISSPGYNKQELMEHPAEKWHALFYKKKIFRK